MPTNTLAKDQQCTIDANQGYRALTIELTSGDSASVHYDGKDEIVTKNHQVSVMDKDKIPGTYRNDGPGSVKVSYQ